MVAKKNYSKLRWQKQVKAMGTKGELGRGGRFKAIAEKGAEQYGAAERGAAVAAVIGRKKYGKKRFQAMAVAGKKRRK